LVKKEGEKPKKVTTNMIELKGTTVDKAAEKRLGDFYGKGAR
jgi:hypothetical protein